MDIKDKEIIISIFVTNFIKDYFEYYYHYKLFNDDRLRFGLCSSNELEKQELIKKEIEQTKDKLYKYPDSELVLSYLRSFDSNSLEYIDDINKRVDIWIKRVVDHFEIDHYINHNYIDDEIIGLILAQVECIKDEIYWDFDFETFIEYKYNSDFVKTLLEYCNIVVYSERLNNLRVIVNQNGLDKPPHQETIKQPDKVTIKHPFNDDDNTLNLFNYIVDNWDYKHDIKWAYIYNFIDDSKIYHNDYERYVRETQNFKGLFNYHNANSKKVYDALNKLKKSFIENYR